MSSESNPQTSTTSTEEEDDATTTTTSLLNISPHVKQIVINVGTSIDPVLPAESMGPCARSIAIEPIVGHRIPPHPQVDVVHAAVSGHPGVASMNVYNEGGQSSSLAKPSTNSYWNSNRGRGDGRTVIVPVVTLSSVIHAVPNSTEIALVMTDMQGFDFAAVREAGPTLLERGVRFLKTEVWMNDHCTYHAENDFCRDWLPYMTRLGYDIRKLRESRFTRQFRFTGDAEKLRERCKKQLEDNPTRPGVTESAGLLTDTDAFWVRRGTPEDVPFPDCPNMKQPTRIFTSEEYATCGS